MPEPAPRRAPAGEDVPGWHRSALAPDAAATVRVRGTDPGPEIVLVGRGDDALASAALAALALELDPDALRGACTIVPACALDDPATADALETGPLARADLVLEIAADDAALRWSTAAIVRLAPDARRGARADPVAEAAMVAFGAPESVRLHAGADARGAGAPLVRPDIDLGGDPDEAPAPRPLAERAAGRGVPHVEVRLGGAGTAHERLATLRAGCRNVLVDAGVLDAALELRVTRHLELGPCAGGRGGTREIGTTVLAGARGRLEMAASPGDGVHAGAVLARVHDPDRPGAEPAELLVPHDGAVLACRADGPMAPGDRIALIADEIQP